MADENVAGPASIIVNSAKNTVYETAGATVLTSAGCNVTGNNAVAGQEAIPGFVNNASTLTHAAGSIKGGDGNTADDLQGAPAIASTVDVSFSVTGGTITGGAPATGAWSGSTGVVSANPSAFAGSGGTCTGGVAGPSSNMQGGTALAIFLNSASLTISGGTWTGGAGDGSGAQGYALGFNIANLQTLTINGGTWTGGAVGNIEAGSKVRVYTAPGFVPTYPDGGAFVATSGAGYIDYTPPFGPPPRPYLIESHRNRRRPTRHDFFYR